MQLSIDQQEQYHRRGWLVVKGLIPLDDVRRAAAELDGAHEAAAIGEARDGRPPWKDAHVSWDVTLPDGPQRIEQLMGSDVVSPALGRIGRSNAVIDVLDQLMPPDEAIVLFHSKTLMRAAEATSRFPWHQDYGYWHYSHHKPLHLNCTIAIEAQTVESGCLKYVEGSQHRGPVEHRQIETLDVSSFGIGLSTDLDAYQGVPVEYEPGDAIFFGPLVIHGSDINRTGRQARFNTFAYDLAGNRKEAFPDPLLRERASRLRVA